MGEILCDEVDLARALQLEQLRLANDFVKRKRTVLAAHERNCAESAAVVAPFTDLQVPDVREVSGIEPHTWMKIIAHFPEQSSFRELRHESLHLRRAEGEIDLRECFEQLLLVSLDHAPDRNY